MTPDPVKTKQRAFFIGAGERKREEEGT